MDTRKTDGRPGRNETALLDLLKYALNPAGPPPEAADWTAAADLAAFHSVLPLLYGALEKNPSVPEAVWARAEREARRIALQTYRLLFLSRFLTDRLTAAGIPAAVLKGVTAAAPYPEPELRKSGDVDLLLLEPERLEDACRALEGCGCVRHREQLALHHVSFTLDGVDVELHTMLAEPFDNAAINRYMEQVLAECRERVVPLEIMGARIPGLPPGYQAYQLLLHMLQHYLRSGFGLKLLCDWTAFWRQDLPEEERRTYRRLVEESGLKGFSDAVTLACCLCLGLEREWAAWMDLGRREDAARGLLADILEGGEFGKSSKTRMVVLREQGLRGYVREFHHQMCLHFPRGSRCPLSWPVLYIVTLFRFLRNNRKMRGVSLRAVLRKAGQRSRAIRQMGLWRRDE